MYKAEKNGNTLNIKGGIKMGKKIKKITYISIILTIIVVLCLIAAMIININKMYTEYREQALDYKTSITEGSTGDDFVEGYEEASSSIGKTVEESKKEETKTNENKIENKEENKTESKTETKTESKSKTETKARHPAHKYGADHKEPHPACFLNFAHPGHEVGKHGGKIVFFHILLTCAVGKKLFHQHVHCQESLLSGYPFGGYHRTEREALAAFCLMGNGNAVDG